MNIDDFKKCDSGVGTSLKGYAAIPKDKAVAVMGIPHKFETDLSPDGKIAHYWCFEVLGEIVTCYYRVDDTADTNRLRRMHIGGKQNSAAWFVAMLFDLKASEWVIFDVIADGSGNYEPMKYWNGIGV